MSINIWVKCPECNTDMGKIYLAFDAMRTDKKIEYAKKNNIDITKFLSAPNVDIDFSEEFDKLCIKKECCRVHLTTIKS